MFRLAKRLAALGEQFYSITPATGLSNPRLVHVNRELQAVLDLLDVDDERLTQIVSAQEAIVAYPALALVYAGHQFGIAVPQLGDGRALLIAEQMAADGRIWELQLKGAGKTPFSRMGDGRAVLRSTIREYLCSHGLNKLAVPTTQALAMIHSSDPVYREQVETAAIVLRVAPSFLRFGNFEYFAKRGQLVELTKLCKFVCRNYYPEVELANADYPVHFLDLVIKNTAETIAAWQSIGFVHGVMNSDNMSILGLTLDYGPFAFLDSFAPQQIFNHSDSEGRYVYANQPDVAWWNLYRLAEALVPIYPQAEQLEATLAKFADYYKTKYQQLMNAKLGLANFINGDELLLAELLQIMQQHAIDWTFFWRKLSYAAAGLAELKQHYPQAVGLAEWFAKLNQRYLQQSVPESERLEQMQKVNPALVLRSHLLQNAITKAEQGDYSEVASLFSALSEPFRENPCYREYYALAPQWSKHLVLSCSS